MLLVGLTMYFVLPHVHQQVLMKPNVLLVGLTMYFVLSYVHQQVLMCYL